MKLRGWCTLNRPQVVHFNRPVTVLQNAIDVPLLEQHFPDQPVMAYFEFSPNLTQETRQVVQDALLLKAAGLEVKPEEVSEKTGYSLAAVPSDK